MTNSLAEARRYSVPLKLQLWLWFLITVASWLWQLDNHRGFWIVAASVWCWSQWCPDHWRVSSSPGPAQSHSRDFNLWGVFSSKPFPTLEWITFCLNELEGILSSTRVLADTKRYIEPNKPLGCCLVWVYKCLSQNYSAELSDWGSCYYVTIRMLSSAAHPRIRPTLPLSVPAKQMSLPHPFLHIIQFWMSLRWMHLTSRL